MGRDAHAMYPGSTTSHEPAWAFDYSISKNRNFLFSRNLLGLPLLSWSEFASLASIKGNRWVFEHCIVSHATGKWAGYSVLVGKSSLLRWHMKLIDTDKSRKPDSDPPYFESVSPCYIAKGSSNTISEAWRFPNSINCRWHEGCVKPLPQGDGIENPLKENPKHAHVTQNSN